MPNTVVKLLSADGSEGFPFVRVGRCHADSINYSAIAQLVEHLNRNQRVEGSTPLAGIRLVGHLILKII